MSVGKPVISMDLFGDHDRDAVRDDRDFRVFLAQQQERLQYILPFAY